MVGERRGRSNGTDAATGGGDGYYPAPLPSPFRHTFNPARVAADCTMRRELMRVAQEHENARTEILRALGELYRTHPDFNPGWLYGDSVPG